MYILTPPMRVDEFERWAALPENADRRLEYIAGKVIDVSSNPLSSKIAMLIGAFITVFVRINKLGHVTGADGGYRVGRHRFMPDVGYISAARQAQLPGDVGYNPLAPDLAVEVLSPGNADDEVRFKIATYLSVGTVVWIIDPQMQRVEIYIPGREPFILGIEDTIDGAPALPGLSIAVRDIFPTE